MITKEEIENVHCDGQGGDMYRLAKQLLKERDEALRRGDAYREVAILNLPAKIRYEECKTVDDALNWIDVEAAKILEREAKSPEMKTS